MQHYFVSILQQQPRNNRDPVNVAQDISIINNIGKIKIFKDVALFRYNIAENGQAFTKVPSMMIIIDPK